MTHPVVTAAIGGHEALCLGAAASTQPPFGIPGKDAAGASGDTANLNGSAADSISAAHPIEYRDDYECDVTECSEPVGRPQDHEV